MSWFGEALKLWGDVDPTVGGFADQTYSMVTGGDQDDPGRKQAEALRSTGEGLDDASAQTDVMEGNFNALLGSDPSMEVESAGEAVGPAGAAFATGCGIGQAIEDASKDSGMFHDSHGETEGIGEQAGDRGTQVQEWLDGEGGNKDVDWGIGLVATLAQFMP